MNRRILRPLALGLALMLVLTACGSIKLPFRPEMPGKAEDAAAQEAAEAAPDETEAEGEDTAEPEIRDGAAENGMPALADTPTAGDPNVFHTIRVTDVEDGRVIRIQEYNYDDQWRRTETIEDGVVVEKYTYDRDGNVLTHWTTPPSQFVEYEYDGSGNEISQTFYPFYEPNEEWTRHTYTLDDQGRKIADQLTRYDGTDRLYYTWEYNADGSYTRYFYDNDGELIEISQFNDHDDLTRSESPGLADYSQEYVYEYSEKGFWYKKTSYFGGVLSQVDEYEIDERGDQGAHYITTYDGSGEEVLHYMFSDSQRDENGNLLLIINYYSNYTDSPDRYSYYEKVNSLGEHIGGYPG